MDGALTGRICNKGPEWTGDQLWRITVIQKRAIAHLIE